MKKIIVILLIVALLFGAGVFGFYKVRDVFTRKMISQLSESEEIKKYIEKTDEKLNKIVEEHGSIAKALEKEYNEYIEENGESEISKKAETTEKKASSADDNNTNVDFAEKKQPEENINTKKTEKKVNNNKETQSKKEAGDFWSEPLVKSVYGRFSASEIASMSSMAAGGFTAEEKKKIKSIVFSRVSGSEINQIIALYNKYY